MAFLDYNITRMSEFSIILDPASLIRVRSGKQGLWRTLARSPLRDCRPGDGLWVKQACVGGKWSDGVGRPQEQFSPIHAAQFVVFADGCRQFRDGSGHDGALLTSPKLVWTPAIHMPRWAARTVLIVDEVRHERLWDFNFADLRDEGQIGSLAGFFYSWQQPTRGIWRSAKNAVAAIWDAAHGNPGDRWADNPEVLFIRFSLKAQQRAKPETGAAL
jgi:hypothetical protein